MNLTLEQRFSYYLGRNLTDIKAISLEVANKYKDFKQDGIYFYKGSKNYPTDFRFEHGYVHPGWWWGENHGFQV